MLIVSPSLLTDTIVPDPIARVMKTVKIVRININKQIRSVVLIMYFYIGQLDDPRLEKCVQSKEDNTRNHDTEGTSYIYFLFNYHSMCFILHTMKKHI